MNRKRFTADLIQRALKIITKEQYGYLDDLITKLQDELKLDEETIINLYEVLLTLGYIKQGFTRIDQNTYITSWSATHKAYKDGLPLWKYIIWLLTGKI